VVLGVKESVWEQIKGWTVLNSPGKTADDYKMADWAARPAGGSFRFAGPLDKVSGIVNNSAF
jgi:hypothetical protein